MPINRLYEVCFGTYESIDNIHMRKAMPINGPWIVLNVVYSSAQIRKIVLGGWSTCT